MKTLLALVAIALLMVLCASLAHGQEYRIVVIDGVEYRALNAEEMAKVAQTYRERDNLMKQVSVLEETVLLKDRLILGKDSELRLVTEKLTKEKDFWESEFLRQREVNSRLETTLKSCTRKILGVFRICRL